MTEAEHVDEVADRQTCTLCGHDFPSPVELHHSEQECEQLRGADTSVQGNEDADPDLQAATDLKAYWARPVRLLPPGAELHAD